MDTTKPKLKVINLWALPGAGKSTTASALFSAMKLKGYRVELVTEVAKDKTYAQDHKALGNQLLLLGLQEHRLRVLEGEVEWAISDSPLPLGLVYASTEDGEMLEDVAYDAYDRYENHDFYVRRVKPYSKYGRKQTESEALALDINIRGVMNTATEGRHVVEVPGDVTAWETIMKELRL